MKDPYITISQEDFDTIQSRCEDFQQTVNDETRPCVKVFNPLSAKNISELELIREVSQELQANKDEFIRKAAQDAKEMKEEELEKAKALKGEKGEDANAEKGEDAKEEKGEEVKEG